MTYQVFIDGQSGTTGLHLQERLANRKDITLLHIAVAERKDIHRRQDLINAADIVFLCLPDAAAIEAVKLCNNEKTIIIDASTAHRTNDQWVYGLPELSPAYRQQIATAKRIANPGCYATGANCILFPLRQAGILPADYPVTIHAVSGYSGGGKTMIHDYETESPNKDLIYTRPYALGLKHKHLPEIQKVSGLAQPPIFNPQVGDFYAGMTVSIPIYSHLLYNHPGQKEVFAALMEHYKGEKFITVKEPPESGFLSAGENTGSNFLTIYVCGNDQQITITSVLDNLGKGASGAAVQNMNIALGLNEELSLI